MSGETEERPSGWTTDTLLAHLDRVLKEVDRRYQDRYESTLSNVHELLTLHRAAVESLVHAERHTREASLSAQQKAVDAALASERRATDLAENMAQKWRDQANEWRGTVVDILKQFATVLSVEALEKRVDKLEKGRDEQSGAAKYLTAFVGVTVGILVIVSTAIIIFSR